MSDIVEASRRFQEDTAPKIEAKIVKALNDGWEGTQGDEQTFDDKRESIEREIKKRFKGADTAEIDEMVDYMMENFVFRVFPYQTVAEHSLAEAAPDLLAALKQAVEICKHSDNQFSIAKGGVSFAGLIPDWEAAIKKAEAR